MKQIKNFAQSHYFIFLCFFVLAYILMIPDDLRVGTDDTAWIVRINELGIFDWVKERAITWQPRLFSDLCVAFFVNHVGLWKLVNAFMMTVLLFTIDKILSIRDTKLQIHRRISFAVIAAFFLIFPYVLMSSVFWFVGSQFYLWPLSLALIALVPFFRALYGEDTVYKNKVFIPIFFLCGILGGYMEQTVALLMCFSVLTIAFMLIRKRRVPAMLWAQFGVILLNGIVFLYGTFTSPRMHDAEMLGYLPGYEDLSARVKLFLGMNVTNHHLITSSNLLLLALALLAGYAVYRRFTNYRVSANLPTGEHGGIPENAGNKAVWFRYIAFAPAGYVLLAVLPFRALLSGAWQNTLMNIDATGGELRAGDHDTPGIFDIIYRAYPLDGTPTAPLDFFPMFLAILMIAFLGVLIFLAFREPAERFIAVTLYLAALASGYIMGFTPTIFATGSRAFFQTNILLVLIVVMLAAQLLRSAPPRIPAKVKVGVFALTVFIVHIILLYQEVYSSAGWIY